MTEPQTQQTKRWLIAVCVSAAVLAIGCDPVTGSQDSVAGAWFQTLQETVNNSPLFSFAADFMAQGLAAWLF